LDKEHFKWLIKKKSEKYGTVFDEPKTILDNKKWFTRDDCKKSETRNKVSPVFFDIPVQFYKNKMTRKKCLKLTEDLDLPLYEDEKLYVLSFIDVPMLAWKYRQSRDHIRKQINRWCDDGPFVNLKRLTKPKNMGGMLLYGIGYWEQTNNPMYEYRIVEFFKQSKTLDNWRRDVLYRKK
jgi:hypothetical protein